MRVIHLNREILRLAVPNILSNIAIPLLGMVDTAMMGHLNSEIYIGAVALGSIIFNFVYWGFGFLRMGTTGLTAQAFGRSDRRECAAILGRGAVVAVVGGLLLIVLQVAIAAAAFALIPGEADVESWARRYFYIRIYAAPATLLLYAIHGWFLGMQNARYPLVLTVLATGANIGFNVLFVLGFGMKSDGVALGTVCAQYLGLAAGVALLVRRYRPWLRRLDWKRVFRLDALQTFFRVNIDIFIRTICLIFSFAFFTSASAAMDSLILAANQILLQYLSLMAYGVDGFAFAAESLVGRLTGAGRPDLLRRAVRRLFGWGLGVGAIFSLAYLFFGDELLRVFTDQPDILATAAPYLHWMIWLPPIGAVAYMWDGVYIGATATRPMRNMMLVATLLVFLPAYYLAEPSLGNDALWLAMLLFMAARGLSLSLLAPRWIFPVTAPSA